MTKQNFFKEREHYYLIWAFNTDTHGSAGNIILPPLSSMLIYNFDAFDIPIALFLRFEPNHFDYHVEYRIYQNLTHLMTIYAGASRDYSVSIQDGKFTYTDVNEIKYEKYFEDVARTNSSEFAIPSNYRIEIYLVNDNVVKRLEFRYYIFSSTRTAKGIRTLSKFIVI